jgi:uncharacterized protein YprB with RNaseH-like and TPR domain
VFVRDDWYPLEHLHGRLPLSAPLAAPPDALSQLCGGDVEPSATRLAFFDIETTGLAGGTGTYVVVAGLGSYEDGAFRMRQYFLADIAHERAMLAMLVDDLARFEGIVTYNGRSFDLPFVDARLTLARLASPWAAMPHADLLHAVRRLYRHRLPGCKLAEAERKLLRFERPDDIPGWLIPSLYFDYIRAGRAAPLRGVLRHNAEDVLSLTGVLACAARLLTGDDTLDPDDAISAGRWWERVRQPLRAGALYRRALPWLEGGDDWAWVASRHAAIARRHFSRDEALPLWRALWAQGDRRAGLELAKHYEHHARDLGAALEVTQALTDGASAPDAGALAVRAARIERKLARGVPQPAVPRRAQPAGRQ